MDIISLVNEVQSAVEQLRRQYGEFDLAMLYNKGSLETRTGWNLIVAAPWADELGRAEATRAVARALGSGLSPENRSAVSRMTVLKTSDEFVRDVTSLYPLAPLTRGIVKGRPIAQLSAGYLTEGSGFIFQAERAVHSRR